MNVVFTGGGTGGHIYPGLAVADAFRELCNKNSLDVKIIWIGSSASLDKNLVQNNVSLNGVKSVDKFYGFPSGKLRRYFSIKNFFDLFKIAFSFFASIFVLKKEKPDFIFSKGGFVSVPPCCAARLLKIKIYTHECDFTPGLATKINAKFATKILVSYKQTSDFFSKKLLNKIVVTGNPVRQIFYNTETYIGLKFLKIEKQTKPILLVLGGSLGAAQINSLIEQNLEWLCERFIVVHQTGKNAFEQDNQKLSISKTGPTLSENSNKNYKPYPFIYNELPHVISAADVVLSRAGANSLWECAVLCKPMVLIPLSSAGSRGDQIDNAEYFERLGEALVLSGSNVNSNELRNALTIMGNEKTRIQYSNAAKKLLDTVHPVDKIASLLFNENCKE